MTKRRDLLKGLMTLPLISSVGSNEVLAADSAISFERDYFKELGLRTFINAAGNYTMLTASLPHP